MKKKDYYKPIIKISKFTLEDVLFGSDSWNDWPETPDVPLN